MNRRNFLQSMIGGVATVAAVRTFPFRVYSFPKEVVLPQGHAPSAEDVLFNPDYKVTLNQNYIYLEKDGVWRIDSVGSHLISARELDIEEAKRIFPGPFHWQDYDRTRYSVLQPDGSVVDA